MTVEEAKKIMYLEKPIIYKGIEFLKINGLIFRKIDGKYDCSLELLDKNKNCLTVVPIEFMDEYSTSELDGEEFKEKYDDLVKDIRKLSFRLFNEIGTGKLISSQEKIRDLVQALLSVDDFIEKELQKEKSA